LYSLLVTAEAGAWDRKRYGLPRARFGEHTAEGLRERYARLDDGALAELRAMPALLAYEQQLDLPARVARISRLFLGSGDELRFECVLFERLLPISAAAIGDLAWELDIGRFEMNRTHWAIKDVDLLKVLTDAGFIEASAADLHLSDGLPPSVRSTPTQILITPTVFSIPRVAPDPRLAAVMMPFAREFDETYQAIQIACTAAGLTCQRADDVWDESTLIQDVFNLIYRSAVTIVDLSGRNSNVMYETGIAHTLGRPVVPISRVVDNLPFDLAHHRILTYLPNAEGLAVMTTKLEQRLRTLIDRQLFRPS